MEITGYRRRVRVTMRLEGRGCVRWGGIRHHHGAHCGRDQRRPLRFAALQRARLLVIMAAGRGALCICAGLEVGSRLSRMDARSVRHNPMDCF